MVNIESAWRRLSALPEFKGRSLADFRYLNFPQTLVVPGSTDLDHPAQVGPVPQQFPGGAIVLSVGADSVPDVQPSQPFLQGRQRFNLQLSYGTNEQLVTVPGLASAILGDGWLTQFPGKELYLPPQQVVLAIAQNTTPEQIRITISYGCLVWRWAQ